MANQTITQLPDAGPITGTELVPIVQNGGTYKTTTAAISASPSQPYQYLTIVQTPQLPNSRFLSTGTGLGLVDGGAQSFYRITLNGVAGTLESMGNGFGVKVGGTMTPRSIAVSGAGLSISNGDGQSGNPTVSLDGTVGSLANNGGTGFLALPGNGSVSGRTLTGTANQIGITNPNGIAGNPTFSIADNPVLPGTGAVTVPVGNDVQKPAGSNGQIRYNTTTTRFEGYQNNTWVNFGVGDGTVTSVTGTANQITVVNGLVAPVVSIASNPVLPGTASVTLPQGATVLRPGSPQNGMLRYNTDTALLEAYLNNAWASLASGSGVTSVLTGTGLEGGPITSTGTISIANTAVTAGSYGSSSQVPSFTVNAQGQLTAAANIAISPTDIGAVTSVSGTANEIASTGGQTPVISLPTSMTLTGKTISGGSYNMTAASVASDQVTTNTAAQTLTNKTISGSTNTLSNIANSSLTNSSLTVGTTNIALGATAATLGGLTSVAVTQDPTSNFELATKQYVDGLVSSGITYHTPVKYEVPSTTGNLNATYNNGAAGVGATLTNAGTLAAFTPDGVVASVNDRILIYSQTNQVQNGIYTVTTVGNGSTPWVLTRATDADSYGIKDTDALGNGDAFFVTSGATGAGETYVVNTPGVIVFGTTPITFVQVSASTVYTGTAPIVVSGSNISLSTVPVNLGGTNITSYTAGDLLYATGSTTLTKLPLGTSGQVLKSTGTAPAWQLNPTYLPIVLHDASSVQISVASGLLPVLLHDGVTTVDVALF
jgi:hypothetical protein